MAISSAQAQREVVPSSVLGMLLVVGAEIMFFAGLISAFTITRAGAPFGSWRLPGETLPAAATAFNSLALLLSGVLVVIAHRQFQQRRPTASRTLLAACVLGALFVGLQGREWASLLGRGITVHSSTLGAFFYVIVGTHAVHAVAALTALGVAWRRMAGGTLTPSFFLGAQTFWYFVVGIWPVIYARVYF